MEDLPAHKPGLPRDSSELLAITDIGTARAVLRRALDELQTLQRTFAHYAERLREQEQRAEGLQARLDDALRPRGPDEDEPVGLRRLYEERIAAMEARHKRELEDSAGKLRDSGAQAMRSVQALAGSERAVLEGQLAFEREERSKELEAVQRAHEARVRALEAELAAARERLAALERERR